MKLVIVPQALAELDEAAARYARSASVELGLAFVAEFERVVRLIVVNPRIGPVFRSTRRRYLLRRFPYSVIYQISTEELRVVAVAHHRRRPGDWAGRK